MPVLAVGGKNALGQAIPDQAKLYAGDVTGRRAPLRSLGRGGKPGTPARAAAAMSSGTGSARLRAVVPSEPRPNTKVY
jgi:hypothetical protein